MVSRSRWIPVAFVWGVASACALVGSTGAREGQPITLTVKNQNFNDATVYAAWQSHNTRLGTVASNQTRTFTVAWRAPQLRVTIYLLSVGGYTTQPMDVQPGDELELFIEPTIDQRIWQRIP